MKRKLIQFSVLLMIFLLSGVGNALAQTENFAIQNMSINVTYSGSSFEPGDTVNITADFNKSVDHASISIFNNPAFQRSNSNLVSASNDYLVTDAPMTPNGDNSFSYNFPVPEDLMGLFGTDISAFDADGNPLYDVGEGGFLDPNGFEVDPYIDIISPESEFAKEKCVKFNFSAYDYAGYGQTGGQIVYTFKLDGVQVNNGVITSGAYKVLEFTLADGYHTWQVNTVDSQKQEHTTGIRTLYVDTKCPSVTLVSPQDCFKHVIGVPEFNFTCNDALAAQYSNDLALSYQLYIDGDIAENFSNYGDEYSGEAYSGNVASGEPIVKQLQLPDGVHNWSVSVQDAAGNSFTSEVRKFYVDVDGFTVSSISPNGVYVSKNPTFIFGVNGGAGLPFTYKLLVDGKEVKASCDCDCDCDGGYSGDQGENSPCGCSGGECDGSCFVVGEDNYSIKASVADGVNKNWTVIITDSTTGRVYQTDLKSFHVDSVAPACVANLKAADAPGLTFWNATIDFPGLMVSWNASTDADLREMPYDVYISTSKPGCIDDMQQVNTDGSETVNQKLESPSDTYLCIEKIEGKDLIYGKDYWVAVIARDNASNYNSNFALCGPVQTYEDMNITLEQGWNLKSVPKRLVDSNACPEDVFGSGSTVIYWDGSCWQFPKTIEPCKGYWVYTKEPLMTNVKFKGMSDGANPDVPASLALKSGWHMIGHTSSYAAPWPTTLVSLNDFNTDNAENYKFSNLITFYKNEGWGGIIPGVINNESTGKYIQGIECLPVAALQVDSYMVPGQGYWIFMKDEGTYASIENVYNPNVGQNPDDGTDDGSDDQTLPDNFDPFDESTWPDWFDLNDPNTWPEGFDLSEWLPSPQV